MSALDRPRVGVSACLLGQPVRFDGGHRRDDFVADTLARFVDFVPVCPEVEAGLGVPRPTLRLLAAPAPGAARLVESRSGADHTEPMTRHAAARAEELAAAALDGYILKKGSPSCGAWRVKVHGGVRGGARGVFATALMARMPQLPVEEEGRLCDARLREAFVERLFAHHRLRRRFGGAWSLGDLIGFHTAEKLLILAHDPESYRRLGRLLAGARNLERADLATRYRELFLTALARPATVGTHGNVLEHMAGYFKRSLDPADRRELRGAIDDYRGRHVPLVVPLGLIAHHARRGAVAYLLGQRYLAPHPRELGLRNHV